MIYRYIGVTLAVLVALYGAYSHGVSVATTRLELVAAVERDEAIKRAVTLSSRLRVTESALLVEQQRTAVVRIEKVTEYVVKYRDKIIEVPHIIKCINNSGLLDVINASMPTVATEQAKR